MVETGGIGGTLASAARLRRRKQMEEVGANVNSDQDTLNSTSQIEFTEHYGSLESGQNWLAPQTPKKSGMANSLDSTE